MHAIVKNNPSVIKEILGEDDDTIAMVKEDSQLDLHWTNGSNHYLYNLDDTGDQQDGAGALPEVIRILKENNITIFEEQ